MTYLTQLRQANQNVTGSTQKQHALGFSRFANVDEPQTMETSTIATTTTTNDVRQQLKCKGFYFLLVLVGLIGSLAVGLGAYGAHVLGPKHEVSAYRKQVYEIANKYQFYHTLALAIVPLARKPQISGCLFLLGMLMFCGSNYYFALSGDLTYIMLTPTGGITLAIGWLSLLIPM